MSRPAERPRAAEYDWSPRREALVYVLAALTYIPLGVVLRTPLLNWVVGPLYLVLFVWAAARLVGRRR